MKRVRATDLPVLARGGVKRLHYFKKHTHQIQHKMNSTRLRGKRCCSDPETSAKRLCISQPIRDLGPSPSTPEQSTSPISAPTVLTPTPSTVRRLRTTLSVIGYQPILFLDHFTTRAEHVALPVYLTERDAVHRMIVEINRHQLLRIQNDDSPLWKGGNTVVSMTVEEQLREIDTVPLLAEHTREYGAGLCETLAEVAGSACACGSNAVGGWTYAIQRVPIILSEGTRW